MTVLRVLKLLFCFKKPEVKNLSYINVLVDQKPILFIVWEVKNAGFVKLIPFKGRYYSSQKAMALSLLYDRQQITMKTANFWRSTKTVLNMQAVQLDQATLSELIKGFRPLNKIEVDSPVLYNIRNRVSIKNLTITARSKPMELKQRFGANIQPFNYP